MIFLVALGVVSGLDIATTLAGFAAGFHERAPFMKLVVELGGPLAIIPARSVLTLVIYRLGARYNAVPKALAVGILIVPVVSNILLIQGP